MLDAKVQQLMENVKEQYSAFINFFRDESQQAPTKSAQRDVLIGLKKTFKRLQRTYPIYKSMAYMVMNHGVDEESEMFTVKLRTDLNWVLTQKEDPKNLLIITVLPEATELEATAVPEPVDTFLETMEILGPDLPDDLLISTNFIGVLDAVGYRAREISIVKTGISKRGIKVVLAKGKRIISLVYHYETSIADITTMLQHLKELKGSEEC